MQKLFHRLLKMANWRQLVHPGPIVALGAIAIISIMTQFLVLEEHSFGLYSDWSTEGERKSTILTALVAYFAFMFWPKVALYNYFRAAFGGPGFVPLGWHPQNPEHKQYLQYCENCLGYKPPRAHHCRTCNRCIHKMDHHCPWINACTGAKNQANFIYFLIFCITGCIHALFYLVPFIYRLFFYRWYYENDRAVYMQLIRYPAWFILCSFLSTGLGVGVIIAVGMLFTLQFHQALKNRSGIEEYIVRKAVMIRKRQDKDISDGFPINEEERFPPFTFPYDLSWKQNLIEIFVNGFKDDGNYCNWPIRYGCSHFDLTIEQLRQKKVKRDNSSSFEIIARYNGRYCPVIAFGWRTAFLPPLIGQPRLDVRPGEIVSVTRGRFSWLYGELIYSPSGIANEEGHHERGWIPKACARLMSEDHENIMKNKLFRNKFE